MGKSLSGKELGEGISQRKDGRYQARFTDRFGKRQTIYSKTLGEIRKKLRNKQYEDENQLNTVSSDITLNEWFDIWIETCKRNCRETTRQSYRVAYNRVRDSLGWRKLNKINLIVMQQAFNELKTDASRKISQRVLVDMYNKALNVDLVSKNVAVQINPIVSQNRTAKERRVLTENETTLFLSYAKKYRHFYEFQLALETGMRIGEILGLRWSDIDFEHRLICVNHTLAYVKCQNKSDHDFGRWKYELHQPKTESGKRKIPMTQCAYRILESQEQKKTRITKSGHHAPVGFEDLIFVTSNNTPISARDTAKVMQDISKAIKKDFPMFSELTPHTLRHTFATRCIERGVNPKTLQIILGHSSINITMNLYCHVTEDTLISEMSKFESRDSFIGV